jgi:hypothetical protein
MVTLPTLEIPSLPSRGCEPHPSELSLFSPTASMVMRPSSDGSSLGQTRRLLVMSCSAHSFPLKTGFAPRTLSRLPFLFASLTHRFEHRLDGMSPHALLGVYK